MVVINAYTEQNLQITKIIIFIHKTKPRNQTHWFIGLKQIEDHDNYKNHQLEHFKYARSSLGAGSRLKNQVF